MKNIFLHGHLTEDVFMVQPLGFKDASYPNYVCKLHKSLYGLKQAPRAWFERFSTHILTLSFVASLYDNSLFVRLDNESYTYLMLYVGDIIITGSNLYFVFALKVVLSSEF